MRDPKVSKHFNTIDDFGGEGRFCINRVLTEKVHDVLNNSSTKMKLGGALCERPIGSVGQALYYEQDPTPQAFSRIQPYLKSEIRGLCVQQLYRRVVAFGQIFGIRCKKDASYEPDPRNSWAIYNCGGVAVMFHHRG